MITFNETLFIQLIALLYTVAGVCSILCGLVGIEKSRQYNFGDIIAGILLVGMVAAATIY